MDRYRSGHNGPDSKSGDGQPSVGSNPTLSATLGRQQWISLDAQKYDSPPEIPGVFRRFGHFYMEQRVIDSKNQHQFFMARNARSGLE